MTTQSLARPMWIAGLPCRSVQIRTKSAWNYYLAEGQASKERPSRSWRDWIIAEAQKGIG